MLKRLPAFLVVATIICLGAFAWTEHRYRTEKEKSFQQLSEYYHVDLLPDIALPQPDGSKSTPPTKESREKEAESARERAALEKALQEEEKGVEAAREDKQQSPRFFSSEPTESIKSFFEGGRLMQVIISLALTGAALFIILSTRYGPKDKHWAYGIVGTIVGFWFRA